MWPKWLTLDFYRARWDDFMAYLDDMPVQALKGFLDAVADILQELPVPEFLQTAKLSDVLAPVMPTIGYFLAQAGVNHAIALLITAVIFRITRKVLTLGIW